jgi:hypothetical protein
MYNNEGDTVCFVNPVLIHEMRLSDKIVVCYFTLCFKAFSFATSLSEHVMEMVSYSSVRTEEDI